MMSDKEVFGSFREMFFSFQLDTIAKETDRLLKAGYAPQYFLLACQQCMEEVGKKFEAGDYFLPELVMAGEIFKQVSSMIKPYFKLGDEQRHLGTIVVGTPKGDIHALGKDIFCLLAEAAGFTVHNLGEDVSPERFIDKVKATGASILGMSALITTTYPYMAQVIELLKENGLREGVKVVIGGGGTSKDLAEKIGADAQTWDAYEGIRIIQSFAGI
ncbi:MAG: cobalamin-dependent protein [Syntrophales bacterium]|jgi:methanogenic corrinoid protein MtbC1